MYASLEDVVRRERFLKLNDRRELVIDAPEPLSIIDCHTHLSHLLKRFHRSPDRRGVRPGYAFVPPLRQFDLHEAYWRTWPADYRLKGLIGAARYWLGELNIYRNIVRSGTYENCFRSQAENGIRMNVMLPLSSVRDDRTLHSLEAARRYPDRLLPFCSIHPFDPQLHQKVRRYKALGAKGLKLIVTDLELRGNLEPVVTLFRACDEAGLPVIFHTGAVTGIDPANLSPRTERLLRSNRVELFGELLSRVSRDFTFIFGHSGTQQYRLVAQYMKTHPATYAEISTQSAESIGYLIDAVGPERILFGSDWPSAPQALALSRVLVATENDRDARERILSRNAERLFGLETAPARNRLFGVDPVQQPQMRYGRDPDPQKNAGNAINS